MVTPGRGEDGGEGGGGGWEVGRVGLKMEENGGGGGWDVGMVGVRFPGG